MGFFDFLKKSAEPAAPAAPAFPVTLAADAKGTVVAMENIPDEVFAQGILGKCCGIDPTEGKISQILTNHNFLLISHGMCCHGPAP